MNRYPDMANTAMTAALSERLGVDPDRLAFGAGSVAVLVARIVREFHAALGLRGPPAPLRGA